MTITSEMEAQNLQHSQIIEISVDVPAGGRSTGASKICGEAPCGFSDSGSSSKDAKERSASMRKLLIAMLQLLLSPCFHSGQQDGKPLLVSLMDFLGSRFLVP
ncbi:unnamed protein product, partial [Vitis vinifera]